MAAASQPPDHGPIKFFSGESDDGREYRRWKTWCMNKMLTMDKLAKSARGAFIMTLLSGKALETVEHLEPGDYQRDSGDDVIWKLLDARYPKLEVADELGETLTDVFNLRAKEGETMKQWTSRASELFDRCKRKTGVKFPKEARGWILLHRAILTEEQKAVVVARARGDLKRESIAAALRSCYPELTVRKKPIAYVEETLAVHDTEQEDRDDVDQEFADVTQFLADHGNSDVDTEGEAFNEDDVAEVLAASWKERRQELNKLQKTRQFKQARAVKRSFRVVNEELKRNTTCNKCGKKGHWARECRSNVAKGSSKGASAASGTAGAAMVQSAPMTMLQKLQQLQVQAHRLLTPSEPQEVLLVSSPGYGVLDSGCGRTIIGEQTLKDFCNLWSQQGVLIPDPTAETHQFRFGNGSVETSTRSVNIPVCLAGKQGIVRAAIVQGSAPVLISRSALKSLKATLDFAKDELQIFEGRCVPLKTNSAGQYVVHLMPWSIAVISQYQLSTKSWYHSLSM